MKVWPLYIIRLMDVTESVCFSVNIAVSGHISQHLGFLSSSPDPSAVLLFEGRRLTDCSVLHPKTLPRGKDYRCWSIIGRVSEW